MKLPVRALFFCISQMLFLGCTGTRSSDKYPKLPYFRDIITKKYNAKRIEFDYSNRIGDFVLEVVRWPEDSLTGFDLASGRLITFPIKGKRAYVDELQGYIYTNLNDSAFFRYSIPGLNEELVKLKYLRSNYDSVGRPNPRLGSAEIDVINDSVYSVEMRSKGVCMTMLWDRIHYLLRGAEEDFVIRYTGAKLDLPQCSHVMPSKQFQSLSQSQSLKPFDQVVLRYAKTGHHSNLFGEAVKLYYYRFEIGKSTILFKDFRSSLQIYRLPDHRLIWLDGLDILEFRDR
ncbi:MAG TPA: hypothetical protein VGD65_06435 [Chryseosolibacter sp.]